jgi:hypothetical protein
MAAPIRAKSMLETRAYPLQMDELIAAGDSLSTVQMTASRTAPFPLQPTTLGAAVSAGATTLVLNANPGVGALLLIEPSTGAQERLKVVGISGTGPTWTATVRPVLWANHANAAPVSYEPGMNARLFVDDTPTPVGTVVTPMIRKGAHGQHYVISYLGTCTSGQEVEDEFVLEVLDKVAIGPNIKQPTEMRDVAADFTKLLEEAHQGGATLSSVTASVANQVSTAVGSLTALASPGATTISLNVHPGLGAMLVLTPAGLPTSNTPPERVYVTTVTGSGPFTCTILPDLEFSHAGGVDVTIYPGYNPAFFTATTSTIQGLTAINRARGGQDGTTLQLTWLATTSQAEVLQINALCQIGDIV